MNEIVIRKADFNDLDFILLLEDQIDHERYSKNMLESSLIDNSYINLIAFKNNFSIGYLSASIVLDECSLLKIIVDKDNRKQGIGLMLMQELFKYLESKNISNVYFEVRSDNNKAIGLYDKCGFVKLGERKKYYKDCDAILYRKYLNDKNSFL